MEWKTITEIQKGYSEKKFSPTDVVGYYLDRIDKHNPDVNAFISVFSERATKEARQAHERIEKKKARPLEGVPIAVKDNMLMKGERTTAGSNILKDYKGLYTATVVNKLQDAGAIILGKTNLDEFAIGSSTEFSAFGPSKNPHDTSKVPGGSSGGSAVAVADDLCAASLGSDTGGSIRQPASFCGVVGFKPTYGRVSRYGLIAMTSSLDQIGPFTKSVDDAYTLYATLAGKDQHDATTVEKEVPKPSSVPDNFFKGKKIGYPKTFLEKGLDEEVKNVFTANCEVLRNAGAEIIPMDFKYIGLSLPVYYLIVTSEISSNLARFDGVRYGSQSEADALLDQYIATRTEGFGDEVKRRTLLGTFTLSAGYRDKYYKQALKVRDQIGRELDASLNTVDCMISPTSPTVAFDLGAKISDPLTMYLSDLFTVPANIANIPAISIPSGQARSLPVGFQIFGKRFHEHDVFQYAKAAENLFGQATPHS